MSNWVRPLLTFLIGQTQDDINGRLPGADSRLRRSLLNVLGRVFAGLMHGLYGSLAWLVLQLLPSTCTSLDFLKLHAAIWGLTIKAATAAHGTATVTGTITSTVPAGSQLRRSDGALFTVDANVTLTGTSGTVAVTAVTAGVAGNTAADSELTFVSPAAGIASTAVVVTIAGGADEEAMEALRARILARIRNPPQGGSKADYEAWALSVSQVTRVWVFGRWSGRGTVGISFVCDGREDIIPTSDDRAAVAAAIDLVKPVCPEIIVFSPTADALNPSILLTPDSPAIRDAVEAELIDLLSREASVEASTLSLSHINEAISLAAGEVDHDLVSPVAPVTTAAGHLLVLGTIDWGD